MTNVCINLMKEMRYMLKNIHNKNQFTIITNKTFIKILDTLKT